MNTPVSTTSSLTNPHFVIVLLFIFLSLWKKDQKRNAMWLRVDEPSMLNHIALLFYLSSIIEIRIKKQRNVIARSSILCPLGHARVFFRGVPPTYGQKVSMSRRVRIRQRTNSQSHRFFTISFILLPYTIVSFGGFSNNKIKWCGLIMQSCGKNSHQFKSRFNSGIRRFFYWHFCLRPRVELYKVLHEIVPKRELMPKNAEKLKFLMRFVEIFNKYFTPLVLEEIVEK